MPVIYTDRREAGLALGQKLKEYAGRADTVVLALPRGGLPVAREVADALDAPLDIFLVRKLGVPWQPELAFGAIASGGVIVFNEDLTRSLRLSDAAIAEVVDRERAELERRERLYRNDRPALDLTGKTVIIVDDGLATGATMRAAVKAVKKLGPAKIIAAAPVASRSTCEELSGQPDVLCICGVEPEPFYGVGMWYRDFSQTTDEEVRTLLAAARLASTASAGN